MKNSGSVSVILLMTLGLGVLFFNTTSCQFISGKESPHTLHLASDEKIKGLDPIYADDLYSGIQVGQVYETLLQYHYLKRPYVLAPLLADSLPDVSADRLTYIFHLKKGVFFQDDPCFKATNGKAREMVADDFVYSFKRLADPKLASTGWWILDGKVAGLNQWHDTMFQRGVSDYSQSIEGLRALDSYTFQVHLTKPSAQFLYAMAMHFASVVPHEAVEYYGKDFIAHPVGTGPFRLQEYHPNSKVTWVKNSNFHREYYPSEGSSGDLEEGLLEDAGKPLPFVDRIIFDVMVEEQPKWLNFLVGKLDLTTIPKDNFSSAITAKKELSSELKAKGIQLKIAPGIDVTYVSFNMADPLLGKNKYLRQALSLAYDEETFEALFYNGRAIPAQGPIPPGLDGYDPQFRNPYRQFNLARAKDLLEKAGYPGGKNLPPLEYAGLAGTVGRQIAEYFKKMMDTIGVKLVINYYSWPQFLQVVRNKKAQIWGEAWNGDYPDAENFFQLFYSKNASGGQNGSNYSSTDFDRLYEKSLGLPPGRERTLIYRKMVEKLVEDCPWIFNSHRLSYTLTQPWVKNYKPNDFDRIRYKYYRIDPTLKERQGG